MANQLKLPIKSNVTNVADPIGPTDTATKNYVDSNAVPSSKVNIGESGFVINSYSNVVSLSGYTIPSGTIFTYASTIYFGNEVYCYLTISSNTTLSTTAITWEKSDTTISYKTRPFVSSYTMTNGYGFPYLTTSTTATNKLTVSRINALSDDSGTNWDNSFNLNSPAGNQITSIRNTYMNNIVSSSLITIIPNTNVSTDSNYISYYIATSSGVPEFRGVSGDFGVPLSNCVFGNGLTTIVNGNIMRSINGVVSTLSTNPLFGTPERIKNDVFSQTWLGFINNGVFFIYDTFSRRYRSANLSYIHNETNIQNYRFLDFSITINYYFEFVYYGTYNGNTGFLFVRMQLVDGTESVYNVTNNIQISNTLYDFSKLAGSNGQVLTSSQDVTTGNQVVQWKDLTGNNNLVNSAPLTTTRGDLADILTLPSGVQYTLNSITGDPGTEVYNYIRTNTLVSNYFTFITSSTLTNGTNNALLTASIGNLGLLVNTNITNVTGLNGIYLKNTSGNTLSFIASWQVTFALNTTGNRGAWIQKINDTLASGSQDLGKYAYVLLGAVSGDVIVVSSSCVITLQNNESLGLFAYQNSGGNLVQGGAGGGQVAGKSSQFGLQQLL